VKRTFIIDGNKMARKSLSVVGWMVNEAKQNKTIEGLGSSENRIIEDSEVKLAGSVTKPE
jgi:hypothetical protein